MSTRHSFFKLTHTADHSRRAWWEHGRNRVETARCPVNPHHQPSLARSVPLRIVLPSTETDDFIWTWYSECLLHDRVLEVLRGNGITGFDVKPVVAHVGNKGVAKLVYPEILWELVVTGWAGMAPPESGISLKRECLYCGSRKYFGFTDPAKLIDIHQYDGSDVFMVWPLPSYIFVSERLAKLIETQGWTGAKLTAVDQLEVRDHFPRDSVARQIAPGRLSYYMPEERARQLGEPLGIF